MTTNNRWSRIKDYSKIIINDQVDLANCKKRVDISGDNNTKYELYGVIHHSGSMSSGHYSW